ncbi:efflux RND transporter periplasmic adaptor subunit [Opitutus sp. GAS368]|jgi:multidrug efflux system membrane fusion protein|uniref:efflux RND transporter periplasmic adaptor subunit n=1 Tax=Opitutus sp. GAS368 TaxID=1882749 RepID=UPI00087D45D3|nr:efflux RND transporter periplasmic adaptor subunit [Opitutus sp. GAS368]SDS10323.1 membrane fusion protein, multidrug efflux system [Opitutus sp. GAS368]
MTTTSNSPFNRLRPRFLFAAAGVLAVGAGLYLAAPVHLRAAPAAAPVAPPAPRVTVAPVEQQLVTEYEELTGHVDAMETVELRARVSGHLDAVHFQSGQLVQKGDVLFTIDPRWYKAQFDLASARAEVAAREAARAEKLLAASAISSEEAESRRASAAEARAALETARLDLEHTEVRAPIAGRISRAFVTPGNLVAGSPGNATLLTTIVTVGDAYVYADLDEATLLKFNRLAREGLILTRNGRIPVDLQLADENDYPRHGYIESTDNRVNPATGSLAVRLVFPNEDNALIPGLFARVRIPVSAPQSALLVSERAIGTDQSQKFVFAVGHDNTVTYRTVKLGSVIDGKRVVREGLQPGETIIVNGLQRVRPGMTVAPELQAVATTPAAAPAVDKIAALR